MSKILNDKKFILETSRCKHEFVFNFTVGLRVTVDLYVLNLLENRNAIF